MLDNIAFRFKAGDKMAPLATSHHHRSTTKVTQKPFKSRRETKGALKDKAKGKVNALEKPLRRQTQHQQVLSKIERRNQAKQKQLVKYRQKTRNNSIFSGRNGAPRIIAVVPLCHDVDSSKAVQALNEAVDIGPGAVRNGLIPVTIDRFKQNIQYLALNRELGRCLEACRTADYVLLLLSAEKEVDGLGELILRSIESQGVSNVFVSVQGLENIQPQKKRAQTTLSLKSYISHFFNSHDKLYSLDLTQECSNLVRSFCTTSPKGIRWRDDRSWMLIEDITWPATNIEEHSEVALTGTIRGKGLNSDRLVQIANWGEFQISKICAAPLANNTTLKGDEMQTDAKQESGCIEIPTIEQDDLTDLAPEPVFEADSLNDMDPEDLTERRGVLLDDHHYFEDEEAYIEPPPKRIPKGTSAYQSAWYLDDVSDSGSDLEDYPALDQEMADAPLPQDGLEGLDKRTQIDPTEAVSQAPPASEMFQDPSPADEAEQLAAFRSRHAEAEEDREFPDEIELEPNVLARERLARYRGLKSLRTSTWETAEDKAHEPEVWPRLLEVSDYRGSRNRIVGEALIGGVAPGTRVTIHIKGVPASLCQDAANNRPLSLVSLLRHEHKNAALNFSITLPSTYPTAIKSKEELILQVGPRRMIVNPLFSAVGNTPNNVHKFLRYLHPGQTAIATFVGPMTWGAVPALFFKRTGEDQKLELVATGTALPPDSGRVIAKRVILSAHPYKIHRRLVTLRYMFFNSEDVKWFKALPLFTKRGRSGFIKESLGTHGYFKATFDRPINPQDSVGVSLYKRVWPRLSQPLDGADHNSKVELEKAMDVVET
ncbi:MAG: hypothetical protein M1814_005419 [Vezdaea aestivalis]|nr:MAG: hypothetical protein M1814_005419 [Vezdaea aestivalis]